MNKQHLFKIEINVTYSWQIKYKYLSKKRKKKKTRTDPKLLNGTQNICNFSKNPEKNQRVQKKHIYISLYISLYIYISISLIP